MLAGALFTLIAAQGALAAVLPRAGPIKVVQGNDDGWGVANIRRFFDALNSNGFSSIISAPANQKSGSGSLDLPAIPFLFGASDFNLLPKGSPAVGSNSSDPRINYVNSFPVTAIKKGIELAPKLLGGAPDLVTAGPNVGTNLGLITQFSGTVGVATEALKQGIPAIAFSSDGGSQHVFTEADPQADLYAQVALKLVKAVTASKPFLPAGTALNVNLPASNGSACTKVDDFNFVLTRVNWDINPLTPDVEHCGTNHLPTESKVFDSGNCRVTISVFKDWKIDASAAQQKVVRDKISSLLTCVSV